MHYFIIKLKHSLSLPGELIGKSIPIIVSGERLRLILPTVSQSEGNQNVYGNFDKLVYRGKKFCKHDEEIESGQIISWPSLNGFVNLLVVESSCTILEKVTEDAIINWVFRLCKIIEVETLRPWGKSRPKAEFTETISIFQKRKGGTSQKLEIFAQTPKSQVVNLRVKKYVFDGILFKKCCKLASKHFYPFYHWQFLLDAIFALEINDFRKAVLDSSTSLEMYFSQLIGDKVKGDKEFVDFLLRNLSGLRKKREALEAMRIEILKQDYPRQVENLRNKVIHAGYLPTEEEAVKCLTVVKHLFMSNPSKRYSLNLKHTYDSSVKRDIYSVHF